MRTLRTGSRGTDVKEVQSLLQRLGYYRGSIDGIFGSGTANAVRAFQRDYGLAADGIVGPITFGVMEPLFMGYSVYTIKPGDTLYKIAQNYGTSVARIMAANPGLIPESLQVARRILVPWLDVVDTRIDYTYEIMERDIDAFRRLYPFLEFGSAGQSILGKELYYIKLGTGPNKVFYNGAHHALEWITTPLLMKFVENYAKAYAEGRAIRGYDIRRLFERSTIYILPMVNPDGVDLVLNGLDRNNPYYNQLLQWNTTGRPFSQVWQANIRGVDLNHNYDAAWQESKEAEAQYGITGPGPTRYSGPEPFSEPETRAVRDITYAIDPRLVLAYHSQGEVIYWNFMNLAPPESLRIGQALSGASGYVLDQAVGIASYAGYKDWFIQEYRRPGYTIEVGRGTNPLPISQFPRIYEDNEGLLLLAAVIQ
ncbi:M14 family metallopeptidase [Lutispora thermophila]|uniref:Gamma-D-glutamyl-(L)-meso-diaminopimelate peptidase I. Metallo peptidase. MEROPS family M14C n=1 Tax=Lutispora thermophila DSM 19022 TaxID=1122184 RepID=A0A1M6DJP2_9FIRM|nr:M14 family metallopeptidase [Lutispora thermophila]SHI73343.1 gamma-D-glutamyl-{L}-meso-diaminopimelate peptidase I . Metallo peptidase. MEROPS family M14C [Lutispora thermophila DSM 19022]